MGGRGGSFRFCPAREPTRASGAGPRPRPPTGGDFTADHRPLEAHPQSPTHRNARRAENTGAGETLEFEKPGNAAVIRLLSLLSASGIRPDEVAYAGNGEVTLTCGSLKVLLGGSRQIEDKIGDLADILNSGRLAGLSGILHLEEFDESSAYIFEQTG